MSTISAFACDVYNVMSSDLSLNDKEKSIENLCKNNYLSKEDKEALIHFEPIAAYYCHEAFKRIDMQSVSIDASQSINSIKKCSCDMTSIMRHGCKCGGK